jgi:hypothetical protein
MVNGCPDQASVSDRWKKRRRFGPPPVHGYGFFCGPIPVVALSGASVGLPAAGAAPDLAALAAFSGVPCAVENDLNDM